MITSLPTVRPYAKAIFDLALHDQQLEIWQDRLQVLAVIATEYQQQGLLSDPKITYNQKVDFFTDVVGESIEATNLIKLLTARKKLSLLSEIAVSYQQLFFAHEKILEVKVVSASALAIGQKEQLLNNLQRRYQQYKFLLQYDIDEQLIGGAIIYMAGRVIDYSIKGLLERLKYHLMIKE